MAKAPTTLLFDWTKQTNVHMEFGMIIWLGGTLAKTCPTCMECQFLTGPDVRVKAIVQVKVERKWFSANENDCAGS